MFKTVRCDTALETMLHNVCLSLTHIHIHTDIHREFPLRKVLVKIVLKQRSCGEEMEPGGISNGVSRALGARPATYS